jgi:hypothetical protein
MYLGKIIRGEEPDVASYMIHAGFGHLVNGYRAVIQPVALLDFN